MDEYIKYYRDLAVKKLNKYYQDKDWMDKRYAIENIFAGKNGQQLNHGSITMGNFKDCWPAGFVKKKILEGEYDEDLKNYFGIDEVFEKIVKYDNKDCLIERYKELLVAIRNEMQLSFFWLAGSIIEAVLCEYCKKNNIKSKDNIDEYITALENNNKISKGSTIYTTLQHFRLFRNTIHPTNQNNDFIKDKNLQNRREELDDVIEYFSK